MCLYQMKVFLILFTMCVVSIWHNVEGYPSHKEAEYFTLDFPSNTLSERRESLNNIEHNAHLLRTKTIYKRNVLEPMIQLPPNNKTSVTLPNITLSPSDKSKSVKKELKDTPLNLTGVVVNPSNANPQPTSKDVSAIPSQQANVTEVPSSPQTSKSVPITSPKSSTPSIELISNVTTVESGKNDTSIVSTTDSPDTQNGAKKRGLIVFGTLGLFSAGYLAYKIYKRKKQQRNNDLSFYPNDNQQFKYGVLMSHENDDNLELSNIPQTIDSDDEEIEIFDLENKKFVDNERSSSKYIHHSKDEILSRDDVEILDLNLPGTSDSDPLRSSVDDNLLNFDDIHHRNETVMHNSQKNESFKSRNSDDFFDIL